MAFSAALRRAASAAAPVAIHPLPLARPPRQPLYGDPYPVSEDNDRRENSFPLSFLRVLLFGGKEGNYRRRPPPCHRVGDQVNREVLRLRYSELPLTVNISKGNGPSLEFSCTADGDGVTIDRICLQWRSPLVFPLPLLRSLTRWRSPLLWRKKHSTVFHLTVRSTLAYSSPIVKRSLP
ncbi:hypothetical protein B296_00027512 [Ensete ventricosum]|uniref:Uncharacterized protein n=1 Tax=Ensete ventricosum TaxID=4639 RepID=A0A426ZH38_ENSVE|nr:hypothetical protein B296_00027512 [Ensete ventricosum]